MWEGHKISNNIPRRFDTKVQILPSSYNILTLTLKLNNQFHIATAQEDLGGGQHKSLAVLELRLNWGCAGDLAEKLTSSLFGKQELTIIDTKIRQLRVVDDAYRWITKFPAGRHSQKLGG